MVSDSLRAGSFFWAGKGNKEGKKREREGGWGVGGEEKMSLHGSHCIQSSCIVKNNAAI